MNALFLHESAKEKANLTLRLTGVPIIWSYTFPAMLMILKIFKKYESIANIQMTAITKIQIFSETIFLVITFYGNVCNAYREGGLFVAYSHKPQRKTI